MGGKLGWVNHKQSFVVGVGSSGWPVEAARDHSAVVDRGELVVQFVTALLPDWVLRDTQTSLDQNNLLRRDAVTDDHCGLAYPSVRPKLGPGEKVAPQPVAKTTLKW